MRADVDGMNGYWRSVSIDGIGRSLIYRFH